MVSAAAWIKKTADINSFIAKRIYEACVIHTGFFVSWHVCLAKPLTMKRVILFVAVLAFAGCKKESEDGGVSFTFKPTKNYQYATFSVGLSHTRYGDAVVTLTTTKVKENIQITGVKPGNYWWHANISYSSPQAIGNYDFDGQVIIEKGKLMHITLED